MAETIKDNKKNCTKKMYKYKLRVRKNEIFHFMPHTEREKEENIIEKGKQME